MNNKERLHAARMVRELKGTPDHDQAAKFYSWAFNPDDPMYTPGDETWQDSACRCIKRRWEAYQ